MQTLCAMNHIDYKKTSSNSYEQLFMTLKDLKLGHEDNVEVFRRMVFNVMGRNCDDHSKNFSFLLQEGQSWQLSPAYDVTFAYNPDSKWVSRHLMSLNGKFENFELADFTAVADRFGVGEAKSIISEVGAAIRAWPKLAKEAGVNSSEISRIGGLHVKIK